MGEDPAVFDNSLVAIAAAHAAGAPFVETDCRLTADGDVVLFHDADLSRLLGDPRPLRAVPTAELRDLFDQHGGLLTLGEALSSFPDLRFNVDVKEADAAGPAGRIVAPHGRRVLLTSFSDRTRRNAIATAEKAGAGVPPAASGGQRTIALLRLASALRLQALVRRALRGIDAVQIPVRFGPVRVFTPSLVRAAHLCGVEVHVWTINDPDEMRALVAAGADGIVTDHADVALSTLRPR